MIVLVLLCALRVTVKVEFSNGIVRASTAMELKTKLHGHGHGHGHGHDTDTGIRQFFKN